MDILTLDEFKKLQPKPARAEYLREIRKIFSDNEIRTYWDLRFDAFDYHLKALGLKDTRYGKPVTTKTKPGPKPGFKQKAIPFSSSATNNVKPNQNIIELEYQVVEREEEAIAPPPQLTLEQPKGVTHMISYPSVTGNVAQLRKRLEAILMLVELDGEDAELVLSITIDRK